MGQVKIDLNYDQRKAIKSLKKVKEELKEIRKLSDGAITFASSKDVKNINKNMKKVSKDTQSLTTDMKKLKEQNDKTTKSMKSMAKGTVAMAAAMSIMGDTKNYIADFQVLDKAIYNLGIVAGKSVPEIEQLRTELMNMSSEVPQSAKEIAEALNLLERTGMTHGEALKVLSAGIKLATASGKGLCPSKTFLIVGKTKYSLNTKLRQQCA